MFEMCEHKSLYLSGPLKQTISIYSDTVDRHVQVTLNLSIQMNVNLVDYLKTRFHRNLF